MYPIDGVIKASLPLKSATVFVELPEVGPWRVRFSTTSPTRVAGTEERSNFRTVR